MALPFVFRRRSQLNNRQCTDANRLWDIEDGAGFIIDAGVVSSAGEGSRGTVRLIEALAESQRVRLAFKSIHSELELYYFILFPTPNIYTEINEFLDLVNS